MSQHLHVNTAAVFDAAQSLGNHAEDLRDELQQLGRQWDDLSHSWSGVAASAFTPPWQEWHDAALKLTDSLAETAQRLAQAAVSYEEQDADAAHAVQSAGDGLSL